MIIKLSDIDNDPIKVAKLIFTKEGYYSDDWVKDCANEIIVNSVKNTFHKASYEEWIESCTCGLDSGRVYLWCNPPHLVIDPFGGHSLIFESTIIGDLVEVEVDNFYLEG